ncbi:PH domain-containing protein [Neobacillus sp. 114]|uniref:PH domain-containing protein n=1 Tax=Neobacillus sp. 114 TaxID=3048535 RepID=UPI0032E49AC3
MMSEPKRLHPIASVINTGKRLKSLFIPLAAIFFSGGREGKESLFITLGIAFVVVIFTFISGLISWLKYTYRFENNELRIEYGIFIRKKRYIPFERIQSIDLTEGILQQLFGLVKVQIETAGSSGDEEAEAVLSAINKAEAKLIQEYVAAAKTGDSEVANHQVAKPIFKITTPELLLLSLTSGGIGVVISALFALLSQFDDFIPFKKIFGGLEDWAVHNLILIAIMVFVGFFLAWLIALVMTMLKYANFTVVKTKKDFVISQGLLEKKQITIPLNRIQAIRISENPIRQLLGYGTVYVESAGGSIENKDGANVILLPIMKVRELSAIIGPYLPEFHFTTSFTPVPKRALRRYIFRSWFIPVPVAAAAIFFFKIWGLFSLLLIGLFTFWAILKYQTAGWSLDGQQLTLRFQTTNRTTVFMKKNKIQSLEIRESYFQRNKELGTIEAYVKSGLGGAGGTVVDMEKSEVEKIFGWYSKEQKNREAARG